MKKLMIVLACAMLLMFDASYNQVQAQQDAQFSMYMFNGLAINPAYAGSRERLAITALYRHQWAGFDGAPRTAVLNAHAPLMNDRIGLGISIASDNLGPTNVITLNADYAYRIPIAMDKKWGGRLAVGINATFNYYNQRFTEVSTINQGDAAFQDNFNASRPNFGWGLYYKSEQFFVGFSVPHFLNYSLGESFSLEGTDTDLARTSRHIFATAGAIFKLNDNLKFKPTMLYKFVKEGPNSIDVNANFLIKEALWLGAGYRFGFGQGAEFSSDGAIVMIEYMFAKSFRVGYAYDITISELRKYSGGTHEIMVGYELGRENSYLTPRRMSYF